MYGETAGEAETLIPSEGLSPHVRGNHWLVTGFETQRRSIPCSATIKMRMQRQSR